MELIPKETLQAMLEREEGLRHSPDVLTRMGALQKKGLDWIPVAVEVQEQVVREFFPDPAANTALLLFQLRTASRRFPDLAPISVYVRNNIARQGTLQVGDDAPSDFYLSQGGVLFPFKELITGPKPVIVLAGSYT